MIRKHHEFFIADSNIPVLSLPKENNGDLNGSLAGVWLLTWFIEARRT
jgi:hypothetical protein